MFERRLDENILNEVADKKLQFRTAPTHPSTEEMAVEIKRAYAEIERQRALIERAKTFANHCIEYGTSAMGADMARKWLKDASGGVK